MVLDKKKQEYLQELICQGNYEEAETVLTQGEREVNEWDEVSAILAANVYHHLEKRESEWKAIHEGLLCNTRSAELYVMLGEYYFSENLIQAILCYENALFYAKEPEDREYIQSMIQVLHEEYKIAVPKTAIVILSYNTLDYTKKCIESIRENVASDSCQIIVVDNASTDGSVEWLRQQKDILLRENDANAGFPAGCNQGIAMAEEEADIFLLNSDTILPSNALFWLKMGLYENEQIGTVGSVSNRVANLQQIQGKWNSVEEILAFADTVNVPMKYPYEEKLFLIGFSLLIKRSAMKKVGVLDELFSPGNSEDVDYGLRMLKAGYQNLLCRNSFVLHFGSQSFGKLGQEFAGILQKNQEKLNRKWGMDMSYYMFPRLELVNQIKDEQEKPLQVLDIGCGCGAIMARVRGEHPNAIVHGIELVREAAELAAGVGDVICGNVEEINFPYENNYFDYCIMGDVLEHLHDPGKVLQRLYKHMKPGGKIIVSMPNVKHWSVIIPLLRDDLFPYADSGILDKTHLKMYTGREIQRLVINSGYKVEQLLYTSIGEPDKDSDKLLRQILSHMPNKDRMQFIAYQYVVVASVIK